MDGCYKGNYRVGLGWELGVIDHHEQLVEDYGVRWYEGYGGTCCSPKSQTPLLPVIFVDQTPTCYGYYVPTSAM